MCLKDIILVDDIILIIKVNINSLLLNNHDSHNLNISFPSIIILLKLYRQCLEIFNKIEIYIDSGIWCGTNILKSIALGVTAVGIRHSIIFATNYSQALDRQQ